MQRGFRHESLDLVGHANVTNGDPALQLLLMLKKRFGDVPIQFDFESRDVAARRRQSVLSLEMEKVLFTMNVGRPKDDAFDAVALGAKDILEQSTIGGVVDGPIEKPVVEIIIAAKMLRVLVLPRGGAIGDHKVVRGREFGGYFATRPPVAAPQKEIRVVFHLGHRHGVAAAVAVH